MLTRPNWNTSWSSSAWLTVRWRSLRVADVVPDMVMDPAIFKYLK